jgi:hypothetical protein
MKWLISKGVVVMPCRQLFVKKTSLSYAIDLTSVKIVLNKRHGMVASFE